MSLNIAQLLFQKTVLNSRSKKASEMSNYDDGKHFEKAKESHVCKLVYFLA